MCVNIMVCISINTVCAPLFQMCDFAYVYGTLYNKLKEL